MCPWERLVFRSCHDGAAPARAQADATPAPGSALGRLEGAVLTDDPAVMESRADNEKWIGRLVHAQTLRNEDRRVKTNGVQSAAPPPLRAAVYAELAAPARPRYHWPMNSRHDALTARLQAMLGAPHLGVLAGLHDQLGAGRADHVVLGDPRLGVVVLSSATDRGRKRRSFMLVGELQEYLLVSQDRVLVERDSRHGDEWMHRSYGAGESITLTTGHVLDVDALYQGVLDIAG